MAEVIPIILILAFFVWFAQYNDAGWFYVGFFLLVTGAIALPVPLNVIAKYILWTVMVIWAVGALFGSGRSGSNDHGGFHDDG